MFRIKTDIRHYRCDTRDKVERLIRNWVIRPTDFIYDDDTDEWEPIGEHPSFVELFASLAEEHQNQPQTVITDRAADKAAADKASANSSSSNSQPRSAILRSASASEMERPVPSNEVEGVIRDSDEITVMTERTLDLIGHARSAVEEEKPTTNGKAPPTPPPSIEPPATAAPDEKTELVELPAFDDDDDDDRQDDAQSASTPATDDASSDDLEPPTSESMRESSDIEAQGEPDVEHDEDDVPEDDAPEIDTGSAEDSDASSDVEVASDDTDEEPLPPHGHRLGRHDLPEEVFVTAEISESEASSAGEEQLDELGELEDDVSVMGSESESRSQWNIILDEMPPADDDSAPTQTPGDNDSTEELPLPVEEDSAGETPDPLGDTDEIDLPPTPDAGDEGDEGDEDIDPLRDTVDLGPPPPPDAEAEAEVEVEVDEDELDPLRDTDEVGIQSRPGPDDDTAEETPEVADAADPGDAADQMEEIFEIDEAALDEAFEDLEDSAIAARQSDEENEAAPEDLTEVPILEAIPMRDLDAPSLGYEIDFLDSIEPSQELLDLGIQRSQLSTQRLDGLYSLPEPKESGQLVKRHYYLSNNPSLESSDTMPIPLPMLVSIIASLAIVFMLIILFFVVI